MAGTQYFTKTGDTAPIPTVGQPGPAQQSGTGSTQLRSWLFRGAGLLVVAVVAGLVWWLIRHPTGPIGEPHAAAPTQSPLTSGPFDYTAVAGPISTTNCAAHSYGTVQEWFGDHACKRLSRGLYTTEVNGARVLVSVSVVTMPSADLARELYGLARTSGTGNVKDLVREGVANIPHAPDVAEGQYKSTLNAPRVTIVEANYFGEHSDEQLLTHIAADARRIAGMLR